MIDNVISTISVLNYSFQISSLSWFSKLCIYSHENIILSPMLVLFFIEDNALLTFVYIYFIIGLTFRRYRHYHWFSCFWERGYDLWPRVKGQQAMVTWSATPGWSDGCQTWGTTFFAQQVLVWVWVDLTRIEINAKPSSVHIGFSNSCSDVMILLTLHLFVCTFCHHYKIR